MKEIEIQTQTKFICQKYSLWMDGKRIGLITLSSNLIMNFISVRTVNLHPPPFTVCRSFSCWFVITWPKCQQQHTHTHTCGEKSKIISAKLKRMKTKCVIISWNLCAVRRTQKMVKTILIQKPWVESINKRWREKKTHEKESVNGDA